MVSTCSKGSTSAQGPAADDGKRKTSDSDPSSDNHPPTGTRHDNASIPRLRRRPPSSARTLRGRHGQALHLRGRLRPHGPRSRRRPHALLGLAPRESPVRILEGRRARGLVRADGHGRAHPDRLGHLLRHDEGLGRRRRARLPRRDAAPHGPRLHGLRAPRLLPDGRRHGLVHRHAPRRHADLLPCGRRTRCGSRHARGRRPLGRHLRRQPRARLRPSSRRSPSAFATARPPTSQASCAPGFPTR